MSENQPPKSSKTPPKRNSVWRLPSFLRRGSRSFRSWSRHTFSRDSMLSSIRTFFWVVPLTVLIWFYAEREQLETVPANLQIEARNSDTAPRVVSLITTDVRVSLTGPHGGIDIVQKALGGQLEIDVPQQEPGIHRIAASSLLANNALFVEHGVTLTNFSPEFIEVRVDPIETQKFQVRPKPGDQDRVESFAFVPPTVDISAPRTFMLEHPDRVVYADLGPLDAVPSLDDTPVPVGVDLLSQAKRVSVLPSKVSAKVVFKLQDVRATVPSMAIWVELPANLWLPLNKTWDKYKIDFNFSDLAAPPTAEVPAIRNVHVIGSPEAINKINNPSEQPPRAVLDVHEMVPEPNLGDPTGKVYTAKLKFQLPDKVRIAPEDADHPISFRLVERKAE